MTTIGMCKRYPRVIKKHALNWCGEHKPSNPVVSIDVSDQMEKIVKDGGTITEDKLREWAKLIKPEKPEPRTDLSGDLFPCGPVEELALKFTELMKPAFLTCRSYGDKSSVNLSCSTLKHAQELHHSLIELAKAANLAKVLTNPTDITEGDNLGI